MDDIEETVREDTALLAAANLSESLNRLLRYVRECALADRPSARELRMVLSMARLLAALCEAILDCRDEPSDRHTNNWRRQ